MKKLACLLFVLLVTLGHAQAPLRVLVLPFDASRSFEAYGLGLPTGVQRTLNSLDGIYAPSVAEGGLFVTRANEVGRDAVATATEVFGAEVVISGAVSGDDDSIEVTLAFAGPAFDEPEQIRLQLPADPKGAVAGVTEAVAERLQRDEPSALARIRTIAAETPDITSLGPVSRASSRLGANLGELTAAAELNPESSWALAEHARALALAGRTEPSREAAARAVAANPEDAEAQVIAGIVANAAGENEKAREYFQGALELNPHHALALVGLASSSSDQTEASELLQRALTASPRQLEAVLGLAELEPDHTRALQMLRRASSNLPESVALHSAFVERAVAAGDAAGALAYLRQVLEKPLVASPALYAQAAALPADMSEPALQLVQEGRERFPESSGLQLTEAELLQRAGRDDEAISTLEDLYRRFPESAEVANSLAVALARAGKVERARDVFTSVESGDHLVQVNLGRLLIQAGQARAAVATLEPLLQENQADSELLTLYGVALGRIGRVDEALSALGQALEIDPESQAALRAVELLEQQRRIVGEDAVAFEGEAATAFEQGLYSLETGELEQAAQSFARAHELSDQPLAAFYQGYALHRAGKMRVALTPYRTALEAYPDSDTVLNNLGYAHLQLGRLDLALDTLRRARRANDENPSIHVNLGLTYYGLGRFGEAIESWDRAISLDPDLERELAVVRARAEERRGP